MERRSRGLILGTLGGPPDEVQVHDGSMQMLSHERSGVLVSRGLASFVMALMNSYLCAYLLMCSYL